MRVHFANQKENPDEDNILVFEVDISPDEIRIKETPAGIQFEFNKDFKNLNEPGAPALPSKVLQAALPVDAGNIKVEATSRPRKLFKSPVFIMPVPEYQVAVQEYDNQRLEKDRIERIKDTVEKREHDLRAIPSPFKHVVPHQEKYNRYFTQPSPVAELLNTTVAGNNIIAAIRINAVTIGADFIPELNEHINVTISYSRSRQVQYNRRMTVRTLSPNKEIQESLVSNFKDKVINARDVVDVSHAPWFIYGQFDYLVITDNKRWNSETIEPMEEIGDMKSVFEKLAVWKRQKGLKARVVTVTDIVNGVYGDHKSGAVDLQEVLRNYRFIK